VSGKEGDCSFLSSEGARPQVIYKEAPSTCQRGRGHWVLSWSLPDGSSWETDLLLEAPPFEQDPPPPKAMEHDWLEWWDEIGQKCEATPFVAEGLKVTGWLDGVAEMAMGFLPCGGAVVLIKRYWMGQEVGWLEWSDAVLSCIPYLGKIGGLALRGVAGAAKWFLRSRHLRHLAQGSRYLDDARRLYRRFAGWISNCEPEDNHHLWPIYLGGDADGPTIRMPRRDHRLFHGEFDRKFPNLSRNRFRRPARRGFCDLYHQGKLTYIDIWNALNQHYKEFKNGTYYPNWERHYIQKGEPIFVPIFQCGNYCNVGLPCGGRR